MSHSQTLKNQLNNYFYMQEIENSQVFIEMLHLKCFWDTDNKQIIMKELK